MIKHDSSRRKFVKTVAYVAPVVLTLNALPSFASTGSGNPYDESNRGDNYGGSNSPSPSGSSSGNIDIATANGSGGGSSAGGGLPSIGGSTSASSSGGGGRKKRPWYRFW